MYFYLSFNFCLLFQHILENMREIFGDLSLNASCKMEELPCANRIHPTEYSKICEDEIGHILLDVRTYTQFEMVSLVDTSRSHQNRMLIIPLNILQKMTKDEIESKFSTIIDTHRENATTNIFVLCRRGVNSAVATKLLMAHNLVNCTIKNIDGGLLSWQKNVDNEFPVY